jgi:hypothetical protein
MVKDRGIPAKSRYHERKKEEEEKNQRTESLSFLDSLPAHSFLITHPKDHRHPSSISKETRNHKSTGRVILLLL